MLVPVCGLDNLATFVALLGSKQLRLVVLHDRAGGLHQKLENLVWLKLIERNRVLEFSMFLGPVPSEAGVEDLLRTDAYIAAFNQAYVRELNGLMLTGAELSSPQRMI